METPLQVRLRWLDAIEHLWKQEAAQLRAGDFAGAQASRERAEPLLAQLTGSAGADAALIQPRIESLLAIRRETQDWLAGELTVAHRALDRLGSTRQRLDRIAPAYRAPGAGDAPQFCAQV